MATQSTIQAPHVVSRDQWITERRALLAREKELTHLTDDVSRQRRDLPWVRLEKPYTFQGADGEISLADLFQGRSQLIVYHFMYGPDMKEACPSCSFVADHFDATLPHLGARDVALAAVSRAPYPKLEAFKRRMGWRFPWVSSSDTDFNFAFGVSSTEQQREPGRPALQLRHQRVPAARAGGRERLREAGGRDLPHLLDLRARAWRR